MERQKFGLRAFFAATLRLYNRPLPFNLSVLVKEKSPVKTEDFIHSTKKPRSSVVTIKSLPETKSFLMKSATPSFLSGQL